MVFTVCVAQEVTQPIRSPRVLMTGFYTALKAGRPRSAALRETQIEMLRSVKRSHPYYWASFILSGADGPIVFQ